MSEENAAADTQPRRVVALRKLYIKDMSFESPEAPQIFTQADFRPQTNLNLRTEHRKVGEEPLYEMVLTLTLDAKLEDKTVFLVELQQAGLFFIDGYNDNELGMILGTFCPNSLFPYAREAISGAVQRGGFPEFILQPIDFDALYARSQAEAAKQAEAAQKEQQKVETH